MTTGKYGCPTVARRLLLFGLLSVILPLGSNGQIGELLGPGYPDRRFHLMAMQYCSESVRGALYNTDSTNYVRQLRTVRSSIKTLRQSALLSSLQAEQNLISNVPSYFDRDTQTAGFVIQQIAEGVVDFFRPTSITDMLIEMLYVVCQGANEQVVFQGNVAAGPWEWLAYFKRKITFRTSSPLRTVIVDDVPYKYYNKINGGAPVEVIKRTRQLLGILIQILGKVRLLPYAPVARFAKFAQRILRGIDEVANKMEGSLKRYCDQKKQPFSSIPGIRPTVQNILRFPLVIYNNIKYPLKATAWIMKQGITNDIPQQNDEFQTLLTQSEQVCGYVEYDIPGIAEGGLFSVDLIDFYDGQIELIDSWLIEVNANERRHLESSSFDTELAEYDSRVEFVSGIGAGITAIDDRLGETFDEYIRPYLQEVLIDFPNGLEAVTSRLSVGLDAFNPFIDVLDVFANINLEPPTITFLPGLPDIDTGAILNAVDSVSEFLIDLVCDILDRAAPNVIEGLDLEDLDEDDLCEIIEDFLKDIFTHLRNLSGLDLDILPDPDILFRGFEDILPGFGNFPLDGDYLDFVAYLPEELHDYKDFFNLTLLEENLRGMMSGFTFTPAKIYDKYYNIADVPGIPPGIESGSFFAEDTTEASIVCPLNYTAIMVRADLFAGNCHDDLVGYLRFPCPVDASTCTVNVSDLLFCDLPEVDEIINGIFGAPRYTLSMSYYCFENINDWKIVPLLNHGRVDVEIEKLLAYRGKTGQQRPYTFFTEGILNSLSSGGSNSPESKLEQMKDTFQRRGYGVKDVTTVAKVFCTNANRRIHVDYMDQHIDPCIQGFQNDRRGFGPYEYNRQPSRDLDVGAGRGPFTDLCGYKVLYDNGILTSCASRHDMQVFSDRHPFSRTSMVVYPSDTTGADTIDVCWEDLDNLEWNGTHHVPRTKWEIDWETLASNLEICEVRFIVPKDSSIGDTYEICPFFNYPGFRQGSSDTTYTREYGNVIKYCRNNALDLDGMLTTDYLSEGFNDDTNAIVASLSCEDRSFIESQLSMDIGSGATPFQSPSREEGQYNAPYLAWKQDFDDLNNRCLGEGGDIEACLSSEHNTCDLQAINCLPPSWTWSCVEPPPTEVGLQRAYIWDQDYVPKARVISCETQNVVVKHYDYNGTERVLSYEELRVVPLEVYIVSAAQADEGAVFTWIDITEVVKTHCDNSPNRNECILDPNGVFPVGGRLWEIDSKCLCPGGFARDPNGGLCVPCMAGYARSEGTETCEGCPTGTFSRAGSAECTLCDAGSFSFESEQASCTLCPSGTFSNETGAYNCTECAPGTYQNEVGQTYCDLVNASYYQPDPAENVQLPCPGGTFSSAGATECTLCPIGTFAANGMADQCEPCLEGSYSRLEGSLSCTACPRGFYQDGVGESECTPCPTGLTTIGGAKSETECIAPFSEELLRQIQIDGSDPNFGSSDNAPADNLFSNLRRNLGTNVPMELIPPDDLVRNVDSVPSGCRRLLEKYLTSDYWRYSIDVGMRENGNGHCNGGPWNTAACGFDGGDCCQQTCEPAFVDIGDDDEEVISIEEEFSAGQCVFKNFACLDPVALGGTITSRRCEEQRRRSRRLGHIEEDSNDRTDLFHERRARFLQDCAVDRCSDMAKNDTRVGDGVCHPSLNNDEYCYDAGDCCQSSCIVDDRFVESCVPGVIRDKRNVSCAEGYGCCDPCFNGTDPVIVDISPPIISVVEDFTVECGAIPGSVSADVPSFPVTVSDNDDCFVGSNDTWWFAGKEVLPWNVDGTCGSLDQVTKILFHYEASDDSDNIASKAVTVVVQDTLAPDFGDNCQSSLDIEVGGDATTVQLPSMIAMDQCSGEIPAEFSSYDVAVTDGGLVTLGDETEFVVTATAVDTCGHSTACDVTVVLLFSEAPSFMPSLLPSVGPSNEPSLNPSGRPSDEPSNEPSLIPSDRPSESPSMQPSSTLELQLELSSFKGSPSKFFGSHKKKFKVNILSSDTYSVNLIDRDTLWCGVTGYDTKALDIKEKDVNKDDLMDWEVTFQANLLGIGEQVLASSEGTITIIVTGEVLGGGRFISSEELSLGSSKSSKSEKSSSKSAMMR